MCELPQLRLNCWLLCAMMMDEGWWHVRMGTTASTTAWQVGHTLVLSLGVCVGRGHRLMMWFAAAEA